MGFGVDHESFLEFPYCEELFDFQWRGVYVFDLLICAPTTVFLIFLLIYLKQALKKLKESESLILSTYYGFLWVVVVFNIIRCLIVYVTPRPTVFFGVLFSVANAILLFFEVSVVVFMAHGYMVSGREAIKRTGLITGSVCLFSLVLQIVLIFGVKVPLYSMTGASALCWFAIEAVFVVAYSVVLILPRTCLKDQMPARAAFYHYVGFLLTLHTIRMVGSAIIFFGASIGFCLIDLHLITYYSLFGPILYVCFVRDFFKDISLSQYYMEMDKSGFLDSDT